MIGAPCWANRASFVIFDSCYGDGSRFAATLTRWRKDPARPGRLHYIALDPQGDLSGWRRIAGHGDAVTLDLLAAPLDAALAQLRTHIDFAFLHGIADAGERFARALGRMASPGMTFMAQQLGAAQLRALEANSFQLRQAQEQGQEHGGSADGVTVHGVNISRRPFAPMPAQPTRRALVIGAGLAGSAACQRLVARGWDVTLIERHRHPASEASGNLAGIVMPLLSRDDNLMTRLARAGFLYAQSYWDALGGFGKGGGQGGGMAGARCGVLQLARDAAHADVQRAIAAEQGLPPWFARWLDSAEASAMMNAPALHGAWLFPQGGWVRPPSACGAMLTACGGALTRRFGCGSVALEQTGTGWAVRGHDGAVLAEAPVAILAGGAGVGGFAQAADLPLTSTRGQVSHLAAGSVPVLPFVLCREAYLTPAVRGWHSAGATYDDDDEPELRESSHQANLGKLRALLGDPHAAPEAPLAGRVGFRSVSTDRLPLVGALPDYRASTRMERLRDVPRQRGLFGLLGFASRGLTWAPLAAELLAAQLDGEPLPIEAELVDALDPARFLLRERRC